MISTTKKSLLNIYDFKKNEYNDINSILPNLSTKRNYIYIKNNNLGYNKIWNLQNTINEMVYTKKIGDTFLFLEHKHVITFGKNASKSYLIDNVPSDTEVINTDRGGEVTYHGPGQIVVYPIIDLANYRKSITWYMDFLHSTVIDYLNTININGTKKSEYPGIWVGNNKICAVGVRIKKWVTMHGLALNLSTNLDRYESIVPCGILGLGVTSIANESSNINLDTSIINLMECFSNSIMDFNEA